MAEGDDLSMLVGLAYEAALDDGDAWLRFLARLRDAVGGCQAAIFIQGHRDTSTRMLSLGDPENDRTYEAHYGAVNPWFTRGSHLIAPGAVVTSDWLPDAELRRSEFHADWLAPQNMFYAINGYVFEGRGMVGNFSVARPWSAGGFGACERRLFEHLTPHLQRAVEVQRKIGLRTSGTPLGAWLDEMPHAVFVVDERRRVASHNRAAHALLAAGRGLLVASGGELRASIPEDDARLKKLLGEATGRDRFFRDASGGLMPLAGIDRGRPLVVSVVPIASPVLAFAGQRGAALVIVADPESETAPLSRDLEALYDLTPREAELASRIAAGATLSEAAAAMRIGREAAHTHLSRVMQKTGTHRQAELMRLLLMGLPLARDPAKRSKVS
jgi:DNA-binding CsgD family transcriptional regulator